MTHPAPRVTVRRRHAAGAATRELLLDTAERLFAVHGIDGVSLREIRVAAGQSNSSVIAYHFGSMDGLVHALVAHRYHRIDERRQELFDEATEAGLDADPRTVVWVVVRPLLESIDAGEMFVPFLARLSANTAARSEFWPRDVEDNSVDVLNQLVTRTLGHMPRRIRRGREIQLHNSVLNLLGEHALGGRAISPLRLSNYVDGWVAMLTAPCSGETLALIAGDDPLSP